MDELSSDELIVLIFSVVGACLFLAHWIAILCLSNLAVARARRLTVFLVALGALGAIGFVLVRWSDAEVRSHAIYIVMFLLLGATWLEAIMLLMPLAGLRIYRDAMERGNSAAAITAAGALLGAAICFAGANIGGGATIWSTILPAILATAAWFGAWVIVEVMSGMSESITIDRDLASGWRLSGFLIGAGLVLGRAVAGNYHSASETLRDFVSQGWPATLGILALAVLHRLTRPTPANPCPSAGSRGVLPAAAMVLAAAVYVLSLGWWDGKR